MKNYVRVGKIVNTHGIKGTVKVLSLTDDMDRFEELAYVYTEKDDKKRNILSVRYNKGTVFIELEGIDNMNEAEKFKDSYICISQDQLKELPADSYFIFDLEGLEVYSAEDEYIGKIKHVFQTGANDVYEVKNGDKLYYIPAIKDVVKNVDIENGKMIINIIEGLFE